MRTRGYPGLRILASTLAALSLALGGMVERSVRADPGRRPGGVGRGQRRLVLPAVLPVRTVPVPILMYHLVGALDVGAPPITRALTVSAQAFRQQIDWIVRHGFHAITQEQLFRALEFGARLPTRPLMITFDDGYRDVLWNAAPILARLHIPATDYVITGRVSGPDLSFLTWPELAELERLGIEIGSHTVHHLKLPDLSPANALAELVDSRETLEHHLGHPVQWFAYPGGAIDNAVLPLVREAGYVLAVTTKPGVTQDAREPLELHRYGIRRTTTLKELASILHG